MHIETYKYRVCNHYETIMILVTNSLSESEKNSHFKTTKSTQILSAISHFKQFDVSEQWYNRRSHYKYKLSQHDGTIKPGPICNVKH